MDFVSLTINLNELIGFNTESRVFNINVISIDFLELFLLLPYTMLLYNTIINKRIVNSYSADFFLRNSRVMSVSAIKSTTGSFSQLIGV